MDCDGSICILHIRRYILCIMWQNSNAIFFVGHLQLQLSAVKTEINNVYCILFTNQSNN